MPQPLLLIHGRDALLLQTRRWVLESAGFEVRSTVDAADANRILAAQPVAVLILCHTLSSEDCESILASAHSLQPEARNLVLTANGSGCAASDRELVLGNLAGAKALIAAARKAVLLSSPSAAQYV